MDGEASQSQPCGPGRVRGRGRGRGWGRGRPFKYVPRSSPPTPPDVVVGEGQSVSVNVNVSHSGCCIKDGRKSGQQNDSSAPTPPDVVVGEGQSMSVNVNVSHSGCCIKDGRKSGQQNDCAGMLDLHVSDRLNICDDEDVKISQTRTSTPTHQTETEPFDICPAKQGGGVVLKPPLLVKNRERRKEMKQSSSSSSSSISGVVLRPGMVLLKSYITLSDQVKIVKRCRELGMGHGGFYQPGYGDGTRLHLKMMCLGRNWDPQTSQYGHQRPSDGSHPPHIPPEFHHFVHAAIRDSHSLIQQHSKTPNSNSNLLPFISPDICIVNFYSQNGRLGLHQDKDESEQSIRGGLPVVSFSIGDSADFLYGVERDVDMAQKIVLESGDVLIFGGKSRNVFHGVTAIHPMTTPNSLLQQTNLRPGRLNLTFRQY